MIFEDSRNTPESGNDRLTRLRRRPPEQQTSASLETGWWRAQFAHLIRYVPSGTDYARFRVRGKLIRRRLQTDGLSVAKFRLGDFEKQERQRAESAETVGRGKMTVADAITIHRQRVAGDASLKPRTREYHQQRIAALLRSWPGI